MKKQEILNCIRNEKIVAIVRLKEQKEVAPLVKELIESDIKLLEITSNTPGFSAEISKAKILYPNILIGAGTVTNPSIAEEAIAAGAQFLVTPNVNIDVIQIAHKNDIPVLMGAMTPTEICTAVENGADLIKLFPAGNLGVDYFKSIKSVMNNVDFIAVGGINLSNLEEWLAAGVFGVGLGSALTKLDKDKNTNIKKVVLEYIKLIKQQ
ncbi:bifunctional 4-hydroxy-2-oxoglutarate aldolase/2-dehydro-3-deoxy-phosphogluconate aldolase [Maribacter sp. CXY002]|uniref:bifunctional 4-hydroxy-2-oxoglutarate aldolase/2-dehydro-3-deoxy-phosphogluconate aldolase n=1 Tax=Maribacter luteocoastalis TaxID=3407671 RepID=UPI003B683A37